MIVIQLKGNNAGCFLKGVTTLFTEGGDFYLFIFLNGSIQAECWAQPNLSLPVKPVCMLFQFIQKMLLWEDLHVLTTSHEGQFCRVRVCCHLLPKESHLSSKGVGVLICIEGIRFLLPK